MHLHPVSALYFSQPIAGSFSGARAVDCRLAGRSRANAALVARHESTAHFLHGAGQPVGDVCYCCRSAEDHRNGFRIWRFLCSSERGIAPTWLRRYPVYGRSQIPHYADQHPLLTRPPFFPSSRQNGKGALLLNPSPRRLSLAKSIPLYPTMRDEQVHLVEQAVKEARQETNAR